jgi:predicted RNA binding protein YcfA (HicA-like mRNA interferase family)
MALLRKIFGEKLLKILCNKFDFVFLKQRESYVIISKQIASAKIETVVHIHSELKIDNLNDILKQAQIFEEENLLDLFELYYIQT